MSKVLRELKIHTGDETRFELAKRLVEIAVDENCQGVFWIAVYEGKNICGYSGQHMSPFSEMEAVEHLRQAVIDHETMLQ